MSETNQIFVPFYCPACGNWGVAPIALVQLAPEGTYEVDCIECGTPWVLTWRYDERAVIDE